MTLDSRKTRLFIVLSVVWVVAWAIGIHLDNAGDRWRDDDFVLFGALGLAPVAIPWAIAWILQGKK